MKRTKRNEVYKIPSFLLTDNQVQWKFALEGFSFFSMFPSWSSVLCQGFVLIGFFIPFILHSSALVTPRPAWSTHCFSYISYIWAESTTECSPYAGGVEGNVERVTVVRVGWRRQSTYLPLTDPRGTLEFQKIIFIAQVPRNSTFGYPRSRPANLGVIISPCGWC